MIKAKEEAELGKGKKKKDKKGEEEEEVVVEQKPVFDKTQPANISL